MRIQIRRKYILKGNHHQNAGVLYALDLCGRMGFLSTQLLSWSLCSPSTCGTWCRTGERCWQEGKLGSLKGLVASECVVLSLCPFHFPPQNLSPDPILYPEWTWLKMSGNPTHRSCKRGSKFPRNKQRDEKVQTSWRPGGKEEEGENSGRCYRLKWVVPLGIRTMVSCLWLQFMGSDCCWGRTKVVMQIPNLPHCDLSVDWST